MMTRSGAALLAPEYFCFAVHTLYHYEVKGVHDMAAAEKNTVTSRAHNLIMENREKLSVSGVEEVESFDEAEISMQTSRGRLIIRGSGLHIESLSLDTGDTEIRGLVTDLSYEEVSQSGSLWTRLFK